MEERDLGVIVSCNFKVSKQFIKAARKGNQILGLINRTITCKKRNYFETLQIVSKATFRILHTGLEASFGKEY